MTVASPDSSVPNSAALHRLEAAAASCVECELAQGRTQVVWGSGSPTARIVLVGEAPGKNEDLGGAPFVGAAGKVLDGVLAEVGLSREDLYICNTVKCRPPGNRNPSPVEVRTCAHWLDSQIDAISPSVIVALGAVACARLLETTQPMGAVRGQVRSLGGRIVVPTYHPAAVIYDRTKRPLLVEDFVTVRALSEAGQQMSNRTVDIAVSAQEQMVALGVRIGQLAQPDDLVLLTGDLGAGKTQLTKGVARGLGSPDTVTSPTFNILLAHTGGRLPLYHLDLYRLNRADELEDIDFYGTAESGGVTVVEWGDRFDEVVQLADLTVAIEIAGDTDRIVQLRAHSPRGQELLASVLQQGQVG